MAALFSLISFQRGYQDSLKAELDRLGAHLLVVPKGCPYDAASIALHAACGFTHAGTLPGVGWKLGRWLDSVMMVRPLGPGMSEGRWQRH